MRFGTRLLRLLNLTLPRSLHGTRIKVPLSHGVKVGIRGEPFLLTIFAALIPEADGAVMDVGVNLGQSLVKVKAIDPDRRYIGFEPNPSCVCYVEKLVRANEWKHVTLFPVGLSNETSILELHLFSDAATDGKASFHPEARPYLGTVHKRFVPVLDYSTVDGMITDRVAILKIDVEGAELEVLTGLAPRIRHDQPIIALEMLPDVGDEGVIASVATRQQRTIELLRESGYAIFRVRKGVGERFAGLEPIEDLPSTSSPRECDYLAIPESRSEAVVGRLRSEQAPDPG